MGKRQDLDAVVFDVGNVLLAFDTVGYLRRTVGEPEASRIQRGIFESPHWIELDRGVLTLAEIGARMVADAPEMAAWVAHIPRMHQEVIAEMTDSTAYLPRLKEAGYALYVLSNFGGALFAETRARYDFFSLFDGQLISGDEQIVKPEPHIYRELLARFALDPARTLFIDDRPENIEAALALGMQGMVFTHASQLDTLV